MLQTDALLAPGNSGGPPLRVRRGRGRRGGSPPGQSHRLRGPHPSRSGAGREAGNRKPRSSTVSLRDGTMAWSWRATCVTTWALGGRPRHRVRQALAGPALALLRASEGHERPGGLAQRLPRHRGAWRSVSRALLPVLVSPRTGRSRSAAPPRSIAARSAAWTSPTHSPAVPARPAARRSSPATRKAIRGGGVAPMA